MEKIRSFLLSHLDVILISSCLLLSVMFSSFLGNMMDKYNISTIDRIVITGFTVISLTFIDTAIQTLKHKPKK